MRVLLTNDDGIRAPGLLALVRALSPVHQVYVAAPDRQRSAAAASMTIRGRLTAQPYAFAGCPAAGAYAVSGTPVDCVRLGFSGLFPAPDTVISGVNQGPNRGTDVLYSGTLGAAQEAAIHGYPALALSLDGSHEHPFVHFDTAAMLAERGLRLLKEKPLPFGGYYSVNVPDLPPDKIRGVRYAPLGLVLYEAAYEELPPEAGQRVFVETGGRIPNPEGFRDTDEYWLQAGYVTVTALGFDCALPLSDPDRQTITAILKG